MNSPKISVVICTYNRAKFIGEALESLAQQELGKDEFEIIIVNNNCTDDTERICLQFILDEPTLDVNYVIETNQGLSFARNRGIKESKHEIITYIDDDAYAKPSFLANIQSFFQSTPAAVGVGGKVIPRYEIEEPKWMNKYLHGFVSKMDKGAQVKKFAKKEYPVGCNMTYTKAILEQAEGFNNKLKWRADDKYIGFQIQNLSNEVYYVPTVEVEHTIDAHRTSDENFKNLSIKFGNEEAIRVKDEGGFSFFKKVIEFIFKLAGSCVIMLMFILKGNFTKGKYTFLYRWWATLGLLK